MILVVFITSISVYYGHTYVLAICFFVMLVFSVFSYFGFYINPLVGKDYAGVVVTYAISAVTAVPFYVLCINACIDCLSVSISRFIFQKILNKNEWKDVVVYILLDIVVAAFLFVLTGIVMLLLGMLLIHAVTFCGDIIVNQFDLESTIGEVRRIIVQSYIGIQGIDSMSDDDLSISKSLWFFYVSSLVPTIINFVILLVLMLSKLINSIVVKIFSWLHRILLEEKMGIKKVKRISQTVKTTSLVSILTTGVLYATCYLYVCIFKL